MLRFNKKDIIKKRIPVDQFCSNSLRTAKEWILFEVTSFQFNIIQKQQKCWNFFFIAIVHYIQNDPKIIYSVGEIIK